MVIYYVFSSTSSTLGIKVTELLSCFWTSFVVIKNVLSLRRKNGENHHIRQFFPFLHPELQQIPDNKKKRGKIKSGSITLFNDFFIQ